jgi:hypothetical protein
MKKVITTLLLLTLFILAAGGTGCGNESNQSEENTQAMSMLLESSQAMSNVSGYRMDGEMLMDAGGSEAASMGLPMTVDIQAEIKITDGKINEHMKLITKSESIGTYETDSYIIGNQFYQYVPGQGWFRMDYGVYMTQNMNIGLLDSNQMEVMAKMARNAEIIGREGGKIGLFFHLSEEFFKTVLESASQSAGEGGQPLPEEWLQQAEGILSGIEADVTIWLWEDSNLVDRMEYKATMGGMPPLENIEQTMLVKMFDYNQNIEVVLPEEAKGAQEFPLPSM